MSLRVIPAYRVVTKFAKEASGLPFEEAVDAIEGRLREYVRSLLSMVHPSIVDLGERSAVTQLGDPEPEVLVRALRELDAGGPKEVAERALALCAERLPRPDLDARVFLLPGDGQSRVLVRQMNGVLGFSLGHQAMAVFLWPVKDWSKWLEYTVIHEYVHLVRNMLFPRGLSGGRLVYMKTQEPETLLDAMVAEGIADSFAIETLPGQEPAWMLARGNNPPPQDNEAAIWARVHRRLGVSDPTEVRRMLFGDNDRIPPWTGYLFGYRIVQSYLKAHPGAKPAGLIGLTGRTLLDESGFIQPET